MVVNIISIKGNGRYDRMRTVNVECSLDPRQMRRANADGLQNEDGRMRAVEFGGRMRMVNAEGRMRTVESGGCGRSKSDADSRIRESYFWHELSSIEVVLDNEVKTNSNEAYATTISTEGNVAYYSTNMVVQEIEAYVTNIVTETNEAYASRNISTENHCIYEN